MSGGHAIIALTALLAGGVFAASVENDALRVVLDESDGSLSVTDKRTSRVWRSMADDHPIAVTAVRTRGASISFEGTAKSVGGSLSGNVSLDGEKVLCSLDAPEDAKFAGGVRNLVGWPAGFIAEKDGRILPPRGFRFDEMQMAHGL